MIKRGTLVHSEKPFIHALASNLRLSRCDHCYSEYELFKCAACHYAKYCDRDCQKAAWRDHKKECSCFKKLPPGRELPNAARILARIIFKLKRGGGNEQGWYDKNKFRMFKDLMSHLDVCKLCLEKQSGLFHPDNVLHVRTLDLAFEASIQLQKWEDSLDFGPKLIPGFEKYYGTHHPILGLHYLKFGKILMFKDACDKALDALEKAQTILRVTHGEDHPLYRTVLSSLLLQAKTLVYNS
ncbi:unnamed protein product [Nesidiocoris tenuis]|uniref:MYND-type domain-containing protein n=1 Tax=Nesidiocoris tenuis TaxID=355587 RepID=A0A6H5H0M1_9HEMI|nr:unnamed protein product [Nesidiocoris tenuis]